MENLDWIAKWARLKPDHLALTDLETYESFSYKKLHYMAEATVAFLKGKIKEGDRVAVLMETSSYLITLFSACQRVGAILVPLNYRLSREEIEHQLNDAQPSLVIYSDQFLDLVALLKDHYSTMKLIDLKDQVHKLVDYRIPIEPYPIDEKTPLFLFYTTGTTAMPKGVVYTNGMLFWNSLNTSMQLGITGEDCTVNILPPYHTSGWNIFLTPLLHNGGRIALMNKIEPDKVLYHLEKQRATLFLALPTILQRLSQSEGFEKANLTSLRYIVSGGEALSAQQMELWKKRKGAFLRPGYGLTEAGPSITSLHQDDVIRKPGSIGKPNFYLDLKIVDTEGKTLDADQVGELCIKGEVVTPGYWNNSVATKDKIKGGWLHTGDLAVRDSEGYYYLKGRRDDMYISGGENIFPQEIEAVLSRHPKIHKVVVLPFEDLRWGQKGVAFIKSEVPIEREEIENFMKDQLAKFKQPKEFVFLEEFPVTGFGKISRPELKRLYHRISKKEKLN